MTTLSAITLTTPAMVMGMGLIALPIAAHLMNRRTRRRVVFPSVRLLVSAAASQSSLFKLRRWWLLLLRCLAVLAIAMAFAQPLWLGAQAGTSGGAGTAVVILVDRSASTAQQYAGVSAVHSMRADAGRVLDSLNPGEDRANIVYATARPYAVLPTMSSNLSVIRAELESFEPTYERADLTGALALAGRMLAEQDGARRLVVLTDLQASNWADAIERLSEQSPLPAGTRVTILPPKQAPPSNLALHEPSAYPPSPRFDRPARLTVLLTNHSDQPQTTTVHLEINDGHAGSQSLAVEPRQTREATFSTPLGRPGGYRVAFSLPGDGLPADDRCYLVVNAVEQTPVVVVTDDDTDLPGTAGYFIVRALAPHGDTRDRYTIRRVHSAEASWPALANAAAVFVGDTGVIPPARLAELHGYMDSGGGVVFFLGDGPSVTNLEALDSLRPNGVLPWKPGFLHDGTGRGGVFTIADGDWRAPLLKRFDEAGRLALSQIQVGRAWAGGAVDERAHMLLWYRDDTPALVWRGVGAGRLVLANFSPEATHSDLGKHGLFLALMQGLADDVQNTHGSKRRNVVGEAVSFTTENRIDPSGPTPSVLHPVRKTPAEAAFSIDDRTSRVTLSAPDTPGFYVTQQGDAVLGVEPVNIDPKESDLRRISADALRSALHTTDVEADIQHAGVGPALQLHGKALWGWLLLGALTMFGVEMALLGYWRR